MTRPRLLAACAELPWPADSGHKLVSLNDLRYLSEVFDIDAINFVSNSVPDSKIRESLAKLQGLLPSVRFLPPVRHDIAAAHGKISKGLQLLRAVAMGIPYIVSKYRNQTYADRVLALVRSNNYEGILIESTPLSFLLLDVPEIQAQLPVLFRAHDVLSETIDKFGTGEGLSLASLFANWEAKRTRHYEERVWKSSEIIAPVTSRLTAMISGRVQTTADTRVTYLPVVTEPVIRGAFQCDSEDGVVLYVGTVHYPPNLQGLQWFIQKVWPLILQRRPQSRFRIIGKGGYLLGTQHASVEILDYVESLDAHYEQASAIVVPLFSGSGIRLKILESFAHGVPVVSTTEGYLGLDVTPGDQLRAADTPSLFATELLEVLGSAEERARLRTRSLDYLQEFHGVGQMRTAVRSLADSMRSCVKPRAIQVGMGQQS